jgi:hypothetical protein
MEDISGADSVLSDPLLDWSTRIHALASSRLLELSGSVEIAGKAGRKVGCPLNVFRARSAPEESRFRCQSNGDAINTSAQEGGGIAVEGASPTIKGNVIQGNLGSNAGGGIGIGFGSPLIQGNITRNNSQDPSVDGGVGGGGISVRGSGSARIIANVIKDNSWNNLGAGSGGGISLFGSGSTLIKNNIITGNIAGSSGAGISMVNFVPGTIVVQNLIAGNSSPGDAGIYWSDSPAALVNNTITDGPASTGSSTAIIVADGLASSLVIANNIVVSSNVATNAFYCSFGDIQNPKKFYNNDIFSSKGSAYGGLCTDQTGKHGNISKRPQFVNPAKNDYQLRAGSPAINAGSTSAPDLPKKDLAGHPRIVNGKIDMGAYEHQGKENDRK